MTESSSARQGVVTRDEQGEGTPLILQVDVDFLRWFKENGGWMSEKLTLGNFEGYGKGMYVVGDAPVKAGEVMFKTPKALQGLHPDAAKTTLQELLGERVDLDRVASEMQTKYTYKAPNIYQALHLQWEMSLGKESFYHPYLATLPSHVGLATGFTDEELDMFQNSDLARVAKQARDSQHHLWHQTLEPIHAILREEAQNASWWTYESFDLARQLVSSRSIVLRSGDKFMIPMAEKLNHKPLELNPFGLTLNHHYQDEGGFVVIKADRDFSPGSQVFEDYGNAPNQELVFFSGFVPEMNYGHYVSIEAPSISPQATTILQALGIPMYEKIQAHSIEKLADSRCWQYLDLALAPPAKVTMASMALEFGDMDQLCKTVPVACGEPGSKGASYLFLKEGAMNMLESFPTALEDDRFLLEQWRTKESTTAIRREHAVLALKFRIKEKEHLARMADAAVEGPPPPGSSNMVFVALVVILISLFWSNRQLRMGT